MKKEYYIQGDPVRAGQIKAAFESKGCEKSNTRDYSNEHWFFFTYKGKVICTDDEVYIDLVKGNPDYTELPLSVEHKFKVHDWVVDGDRVAIIYDLQKNGYVGHDVNRKDFVCRYSDESRLHLWTIADAKDGDVLATDNGWSCIFKAFDGWTFSSYCFMDSENWFCEFGSEVHTPDSRLNGNIHPATKEQRGLLFSNMKEAGYTWDDEKKELLSAVPKFKVGDWITDGNITIQIEDVRNNSYTYSDGVLYSTRTADKVYHLWTIQDAKGGDVLSFNNETIVVFKDMYNATSFHSHCHLEDGIFDISTDDMPDWWRADGFKPATKEQRDLLFRKMKEAGYQWNPDKNKIQSHYDIAYFQPRQWVLVRQGDGCAWRLDIFSNLKEGAVSQFECVGNSMVQCIPFEGNKHLLGTTDMCDECYINW